MTPGRAGAELYDFAVIGAGPAGSALARCLALAGRRVLLIDREAEGRDRVCGGFLGPEAPRLFAALDLVRDWENFSAARLWQLEISGPGARPVRVPLPGAGGFGVDRALFDAWMQAAAVRAGAHFLSRTSGEAQREAGVWRLFLRKDDLRWHVLAGQVVRAHGRRLPRPGLEPEAAFFGCKTIYASVNTPKDCVTLDFARSAHFGFNPLPDGRTAMCAYVTRERMLAAGGDMDGMMENAARENEAIGRKLLGSRRAARWQGCPAQPDYRRRFLDGGSFAVGDAVTMVNPIIGGGMGIAIGSAVLLSQELLRPGARERDRARAYRLAWRRAYGGRLFLGRLLGQIERREALARAVLRVLGAWPRQLEALVRYSRPPLTGLPNPADSRYSCAESDQAGEESHGQIEVGSASPVQQGRSNRAGAQSRYP